MLADINYLEYDPLGDILDEAKNTNPDVLILAGPFVDVKNDKINNGEVCKYTIYIYIYRHNSLSSHLSSQLAAVPIYPFLRISPETMDTSEA